LIILLVSLDDLRGDLSADELRFVAQAWKAAFESKGARLTELTD
jgi:hypothetical protein